MLPDEGADFSDKFYIQLVGTALAAVRQYNLYVIFCGQGRALSLRYDIKYNLILSLKFQYSFSVRVSRINKHRLPLTRELSNALRLTEGEITVI